MTAMFYRNVYKVTNSGNTHARLYIELLDFNMK